MNVHSLFAYYLYEKWCAFDTQLVGLGVWGRFTPTKFVSSVHLCKTVHYMHVKHVCMQAKVSFCTLKTCWVKYNPALGKIWMNPAIGLFRPSD